MNRNELTRRRIKLKGGGNATPYQWNDETVLIRDDALTFLRCIELLNDTNKSAEEKSGEFIPLFFVNWQDAYTACDYDQAVFGDLIKSAVWDVYGIDLQGDKPHETPLWDPVEDASIIRISFRSEYGIDWDDTRSKISFDEFIALISGCSTQSPLGRAIYYRNPKTKPKATKTNRSQIEEWNRLHKAYALKGNRSSRGANERTDAAMNDAFAALKRAAR